MDVSFKEEGMRIYDLVIVGAGTGGCLTAKTAAKQGLKVCLIDAKDTATVGEKACGDAVGKHHFDNLGLTYPKGGELAWELKGSRVFSPDLQTVFKIEGLGASAFMVNRLMFGQRLLREAMDAGAAFFDRTLALKPIIEKGFIRGVLARNSSNEKTAFHAQVTVDASGVQAVLRKQLPVSFGVEVQVKDRDMELAYRELRKLKNPLATPEYGDICVSQEIAPGGYAWVFPEGDYIVNTGLGVQMKPGHPHPREQFYRFLKQHPDLQDSTILDGRGALVPTRRPLLCLVANGFMAVGDAACQVNPIHGGGIGPSMTAGKFAAETAVKAIAVGDVSREGLWGYNIAYMRGYGAKQATLDIFRSFLQRAGDEELRYGMSHYIIKEEDVLRASLYGEVRLNITEKARRFFRARGKLRFLLELRNTAKRMSRVKAHYLRFPEPTGYSAWLKENLRLFRVLSD